MGDLVTAVQETPAGKTLSGFKSKGSSRASVAVFLVVLFCGLSYIAFQVMKDIGHVAFTSVWPLVFLALALFIALGFEFVNGFHDTANAVATVIYTNTLEPNTAVVWSGLCNLTGVLLSSGTVAFAVVMLLPVDLILQMSSGAGYSMVFALLIAAILWNLSTWWLGLPSSSSHTLVGSIFGVGIANQMLNSRTGALGVDWAQAVKVLEALLISPLMGFVFAGLLLLVAKHLFKSPILYQSPKGNQPPPWPIRILLVLTCSGVSFFHGSNDGQKGMGLIMLILIGTVPTAYALNHAISSAQTQEFVVISQQTIQILDRHVDKNGALGTNARTEVLNYIRTGQIQPDTILALRELVKSVNQDVTFYKTLKSIPAQEQTNIRNDMYESSEALRLMAKNHDPAFTPAETAVLKDYKSRLDKSTKFIPDWVKVATALALGLGTMVGWKRIVITVGEKIGKEHLSYAEGASAELIAMATIFAADRFGLPVSTTHVLSSGVAGTMAANGSGVRMSTIRNIAAVWIFTLPAAALLSGLLFCLFRAIS
jgi:PiT family inorganic phosphate transporter